MGRFFIFLVLTFAPIACIIAQTFPNPATLSTGQGTPGTFDPIWTVTTMYPTLPPNPMGLTYTPALINNNCAPGAWVDPASLPPPVNNGNWITSPASPCATNLLEGYCYFRLTLNLPADCNGNGVTTVGSYTLGFDGYVDNTITDVFVNGNSMGISGGAFAVGTQLAITLPGPWLPGINYVDVLVYNFPNGGQANPYGLLLVANSAASAIDTDNDGLADINDQCPCLASTLPGGCPPMIDGDTIICQGESTTLRTPFSGTYLWSTGATIDSIVVSPNANTTYGLTVTDANGTINSSTINVTVNQLPPAAIAPAVAQICEGDNITLTASGGTAYVWSTGPTNAAITVAPTTTTTYTVTITDGNACSATASRTVDVYPIPLYTVSDTICNGGNYTLPDGVVVTVAGTYTSTLTAPVCDTIITTHLTVNNTSQTNLTATTCANQPYTLPNGTITAVAGTYYHTVPNQWGCDSIIELILTVNPVYNNTITATICNGDSWLLPDGISVGQQGTYTSNLLTGAGCDSVIVTTLTVNPTYNNTVSASICNGDSYTLPDGTVTTQQGIYTTNLLTNAGCDSSITTVLNLNPTYNNAIAISICDGDTWQLPDGTTVNQAGTYVSSLLTGLGCDSIITTALTVNPVYQDTVTVSICNNETWQLPDGSTVTQPGSYTSNLTSTRGCDSVIVTQLTVLPVAQVVVYDTICAYQTYTLPAGSVVSTAGTFIDTLAGPNTCDSIITTHLSIIDLQMITATTHVMCNSDNTGTIACTDNGGLLPINYQWSEPSFAGSTIAQAFAGTYTVTATDAFGCSAAQTIIITEPAPLSMVADVADVSCFGSADGSIVLFPMGGAPGYVATFNGDTAVNGTFDGLAPGIYPIALTDANGCEVMDTLAIIEPDAFELMMPTDSLWMELGDTMAIEVSSNYDPATVYQWEPHKGLSCLNCSNPTLTIYDTDTMWLTTSYQSTTQNTECHQLYQLPVVVKENKNLFIPTAFSPNNDGQNDAYQIYGNLKGLRIFNIQIYDRSGEKVFESDDPFFVWDGTHKGELITTGVLVYEVRYAWLSHWESMNNQKGSLTLLR